MSRVDNGQECKQPKHFTDLKDVFFSSDGEQENACVIKWLLDEVGAYLIFR